MSLTHADNADTIRRASKLIGHYLGTAEDGRSMEEILTYMIADLLVYSHETRLETERVLSSAVMHYEHETKEDN